MENEKTVDTLENDDHGLCMVMISIDDLHDFMLKSDVATKSDALVSLISINNSIGVLPVSFLKSRTR